jgi:hypothetical protein
LSSVGFSILQLINPEISKLPWATVEPNDLKGCLKEKCHFLKLEGGDDYYVARGMTSKALPEEDE